MCSLSLQPAFMESPSLTGLVVSVGSMFTLFQIMTLESWSMGIVRPVMTVFPFAWIFFVLFILVATFTMLNLFIGVIVEDDADSACPFG